MKVFQLRAARGVLNLGVRDIASALGFSRSTISLWENKNTFDTLKPQSHNINLLIKFFQEQGVVFLDDHSVSLISSKQVRTEGKLTRFQLRAARTALKLDQQTLADMTGNNRSFVSYAERRNNEVFVPLRENANLKKCITYFESQGIIFYDDLGIKLTKLKNNN